MHLLNHTLSDLFLTFNKIRWLKFLNSHKWFNICHVVVIREQARMIPILLTEEIIAFDH